MPPVDAAAPGGFADMANKTYIYGNIPKRSRNVMKTDFILSGLCRRAVPAVLLLAFAFPALAGAGHSVTDIDIVKEEQEESFIGPATQMKDVNRGEQEETHPGTVVQTKNGTKENQKEPRPEATVQTKDGTREYQKSPLPESGIRIRGVIRDERGETLPGAVVQVRGTRIAVSADLDGRFSLELPAEDAVLLVQYVGMRTEEIPAKGRRTFEIVLKSDSRLDEAVIVGAYGTRQRREDLTGSAFQVNASALKLKPKTRVDNLIEGLAPGLTLVPNTDAAGTTRTRYETRIRGNASLSASNEPLWVIDGVPMYTGTGTNIMPGMTYTVSPLSYMDPNDIESITVLKDADQVTIYGANGSNGVILVTTKSGRKDSPLRISATLNYGVTSIDRSTLFKMMNAAQYLEVAKEAWRNSGNPPETFPYTDNEMNAYSTTSTDWTDLYLGPAPNMYASLSFTGGTKRLTSSLSASWYKENNIVKSDKASRFSLRSKNTFHLTERIKLDAQLAASFNRNDLFPLGREYLECPPIFEPYMPDGGYRLFNLIRDGDEWKKRKFFDNQIPDREENDHTQLTLKTSCNFALSARLARGLLLTTQFAADLQHSHEDVYYSRLTLDGLGENLEPRGYTRRGDATYSTWTHVDRLNFDRSFGRHKLGAVAGMELNDNVVKTLSATASGFMNDNIKEITYAEENSIRANSNTDPRRSMSFFARASYAFDSRYYLSANWRTDGNSGFGKYARWANFWSIGASWNLHKEKFFSSDRIKMLKLKASYGTNGNSRVDASVATGSYSYSSSFAYAGRPGAVIGTVPNPGLSWEKTRMLNTGIRIELAQGFTAEMEYYDNYTSDLLSKIYISRSLSADRVYANVGEIRNRGLELSLESVNLKRGTFLWTTRLNAAHNRNRIEKLYNGMTTSFGTKIWQEGYDSRTFYLVEWAGVDPSDGLPIWKDKDGNFTKTYNTSDRKPGKAATPALTGGLTNSLAFGNWDFSFQLNYTLGGWSLPAYSAYLADGYDIIGGNQAVEIYHYRWKGPGRLSAYPKVSNTTTHSSRHSTRFLYRTTHFKLADVSLSYTLPPRAVKALRMRDVTLSLICDNAYLLTPDQRRGWNSAKTMMNGYPVNRTLTLSLNANF